MGTSELEGDIMAREGGDSGVEARWSARQSVSQFEVVATKSLLPSRLRLQKRWEAKEGINEKIRWSIKLRRINE